MMLQPVRQPQRIAIDGLHRQPRTDPPLLKRHPDRAVIRWISIAVTRIEEIELLLGKEQPPVTVKVLRVVLPDQHLEFALPGRDHVMIWFCRRRKIIRTVIALLMIIYMHLRQPAIVLLQPRLRLDLRLPRPVPVEIEIVMVDPAARPGLPMLPRLRIGIGLLA